ncbi:MAG TPA: YMGG-like glycine zipper-containing protein [Sphingobacteriaceae bacterium]
MKRMAMVIAAASVFAACSNNSQMSSVSREDSIRIAQQSVKMINDSLKLDSFKRAEAQLKAKAEAQKEERIKALETKVAANSSSKNAGYSYGSGNGSYGQPERVPEKKGWSSAAKGAVIGAGAGAVTGILVDKKDARGAVIGGVIGAGTGYAIGRAHDRKTGRVQRY